MWNASIGDPGASQPQMFKFGETFQSCESVIIEQRFVGKEIVQFLKITEMNAAPTTDLSAHQGEKTQSFDLREMD